LFLLFAAASCEKRNAAHGREDARRPLGSDDGLRVPKTAALALRCRAESREAATELPRANALGFHVFVWL
jgi:hypothetical protein